MSGRTSPRSGAVGKTDAGDAALQEDGAGGSQERGGSPAAAEGTPFILLCSSQEQRHFLVK